MPNYYGQYPMYQPGGFQNPAVQQQLSPTQISGASQIQNGGFVSVRNETEARNYPVALGNSVTFKDETAPYIYTKTMGFSQLDVPRFDKYKLVKETPSEPPSEPVEPAVDLKPMSDTIDGLQDEIRTIWGEIEALKKKPVSKTKKKEVEDDDTE